jgi:hypothetical protein
MTVVSADAAYCYDRVNHIIMSLMWLVLTNGNIPAIVVSLICLQTMRFYQWTGFGELKMFFRGKKFITYMMGVGQGNRAAPPSWIQLSAVMVTMIKQLNLRAIINNPISDAIIHSMGASFVDDTDMYTWRDYITDPTELWAQTKIEIAQWSNLLNAMGGALKPEKCVWYQLDYTCTDREWSYTNIVPRKLLITNLDGSKSPIKQEEVTESKKTPGMYNSPAGGNDGHLEHIKSKAMQCVDRMMNSHLPSHIAWVAYRHQLWPGLHYGLLAMTNNIKRMSTLLDNVDYKTLNVLGILQNVTKGLRRLHTMFGGYGMLELPT